MAVFAFIFVFTFAFLFSTDGAIAPGVAQEMGSGQTVPDTRSRPAPWRPAFTPVQPSATVGDQGTGLLRQQAGSGLQGSGSQAPAPVTVPQAPVAGSDNRAASPGVSSPGVSSPGVSSPGVSSPGVSSPRVNSPGVNSPGAGSPQAAFDPSRLPRAVRPESGSTFGNQPVSGTIPRGAGSPGNNTDARSPAPVRRVADSRSSAGSSSVSGRDRSMLPNDAGQVWREYDISPYTSQIRDEEEPQRAIVEWIRRETGTEMWFNRPLGILNAERDRLYVYHTPEIHNVIRPIVDRFVASRGQIQNLDITLCTVEDPAWRTSVARLMQPIAVQSPAVEAWLVSKESAAYLMSRLSTRADFTQHSNGRVVVAEGQHIAIEKTQPVQFVRNVRWTPGTLPGYQPMMTQIDSGYRLSISPLLTRDGNNIEAVIKCEMDQVEKLTPVNIEVPDIRGGPPGQMTINVPQLVSWKLHDRFRWPGDQVLVLSCGVVARPDQTVQTGNRPALFQRQPKRADALLFIEFRGPASGPATRSADLGPVRRPGREPTASETTSNWRSSSR